MSWFLSLVLAFLLHASPCAPSHHPHPHRGQCWSTGHCRPRPGGFHHG